MRLIDVTLPLDHDLTMFGDDHEGALAQYEKGLNAMIAEMDANPIGYGIHFGDACETLAIDHPYYNPATLKKNGDGNPSIPMEQVKSQVERYKPIAGKMVAWVKGNHERRADKFFDMTQEICDRLERPEIYGGYICKITVRDPKGRVMYKVLAYHGRRIAESRAGTEKQRQANRESSLMKCLAPLAGDCLIMAMGHTHRLMVSEPLNRLYLTDDGRKLKQGYIKSRQAADYIDPENRYYVNTGSFLRSQMLGIDTYSEIAGYAPVELGFAVAHFRDGKIQGIEKRVI